MVHIRAWKDSAGFALEIPDKHLGLSEDGLLELIEALQELQEHELTDDDDTYAIEFAIDMQEDE